MEEKSLLIIHQGAFGDLVLTFPAIGILKKYYNTIDGICQAQLGKLACHLDIFHKYIPLESALASSLYSDNINKKIKKIINLYDDVILFSFSRQLEKNINSFRKKPTYRIPPRPPIQYQMAQYQMASLNIHIADYLISSIIQCRLVNHEDSLILKYEDNKEHSLRFLSDKILIHPGSGSKRKNWPVQNFVKLYDALKILDLKPEFILGPADEYLLEHIKKDNCPKKIHSPLNLIDLHSILKTASIYIGNDSGVSHHAAFSGLTCVIIFGPSDPIRWSPLGRAVHIVRYEQLKCLPCFETQKDNCQNPLCLDNITVEKVLSIVKNLICNVS
ncbi:glycosyltransferase family 9 protein [Desulfobacterales bacterium HSG17]|nr:glycosyltransferase family 9 protein [Desulfobacterales bacterium HSG17]